MVATRPKSRVDFCLQKTCWKIYLKIIAGKNSRCKFFCCVNDEGTNGVGIIVVEKWWDKFEVIQVFVSINLMQMVIRTVVFVFLRIHARQADINKSIRDQF